MRGRQSGEAVRGASGQKKGGGGERGSFEEAKEANEGQKTEEERSEGAARKIRRKATEGAKSKRIEEGGTERGGD